MTAATNGAFSLVTTDTAAAAANITITADGTVDINSAGLLTLDSGAAINIEPAACSAILLDGTISIDAGVVTGATSITSTAFVGTIDGVLGGNTPAAITGTTLSVDNFTLNGTELDLSSGDFALDVAGDVEINADGGCINFKDASLALAAIVNTSCVGELRIHEAANYIGLKPPALSANQTWTWPATKGSACNVLTCDGCGVLSWAAAGGGAVSAVANGADNRIATFSSSTALNGETTLLFVDDSCGSLLTIEGDASNARLLLTVNACSTANHRIQWSEGTGDGSTGNMRYQFGHETNANKFSMYSRATAGLSGSAGTGANILEVPDGGYAINVKCGSGMPEIQSGLVKVWGGMNGAGTITACGNCDYNVTSTGKCTTGVFTITSDQDFGSQNEQAWGGMAESGTGIFMDFATPAVGTIVIYMFSHAGAASNTANRFWGFGRQ